MALFVGLGCMIVTASIKRYKHVVNLSDYVVYIQLHVFT